MPPTPTPDTLDATLLSILKGLGGARLRIWAAVLLVAVFVADGLTPLGVAGGVPYVLPVILGLGSKNERFSIAVASIATALCIVGVFTSPMGHGPFPYVIANRVLALFAIWVTALGVRSHVVLLGQLETVHAELRHREALARLGEMAAVVAHEVKNPLAGIMGVLQVLDARERGESERKVIRDVHARLASLAETVDDLLAFARPTELRAEPVDLLELLHDIRDLVLADSHFPDLQVEIDGDPATAHADRTQLRRALHNVVLNAAAAMAGAGVVRISVNQQDDAWRIYVHDQGPGVPEELRGRIFEPFFTTKVQGSGLGLPLVQRTLEAHGGTVDLTCPPTGGTTVTLELPKLSG